MKIKTVLVAGFAAGVGYIMGTAAGRARFEQIRGKATDFLGSPQVQDTVANLSDTVKQNASKLPDPVAGVVNAVADKAKGSAGGQQTPDPTSSTSDLSEGPPASDPLESSFASDPMESSFASGPMESSFAAEPATPFAADPLETSEPETPFASDLPETGYDSDPLEPSTLSDPETPLILDPEPLSSDLTDADDPINPTIPPTTTPPTPSQ